MSDRTLEKHQIIDVSLDFVFKNLPDVLDDYSPIAAECMGRSNTSIYMLGLSDCLLSYIDH